MGDTSAIRVYLKPFDKLVEVVGCDKGGALFAGGSAAEAFASSRITIDKLIGALMSACSALSYLYPIHQ